MFRVFFFLFLFFARRVEDELRKDLLGARVARQKLGVWAGLQCHSGVARPLQKAILCVADLRETLLLSRIYYHTMRNSIASNLLCPFNSLMFPVLLDQNNLKLEE